MKSKHRSINAVRPVTKATKRTVRKKLNADNLLALVRQDFQRVTDSRASNAKITVADTLDGGISDVSTQREFWGQYIYFLQQSSNLL